MSTLSELINNMKLLLDYLKDVQNKYRVMDWLNALHPPIKEITVTGCFFEPILNILSSSLFHFHATDFSFCNDLVMLMFYVDHCPI